MNQKNHRILNNMVSLLEDYRQGQATLRQLIDSLEGSLAALEESLPQSFYSEWYDHWGRLEEILATGTEKAYRKEILEDVSALDVLLSKYTHYDN